MKKLILLLWVLIIIASCVEMVDPDYNGTGEYNEELYNEELYNEELYDESVDDVVIVVDESVDDVVIVVDDSDETYSPLGEFLRGNFELKPIGFRTKDSVEDSTYTGDKTPIYYKFIFEKDLVLFMMKIIDKNGSPIHIKIPIERIRVIEDGTVTKPYIRFKWSTTNNSDNQKGWGYTLEENIIYVNIIGNQDVLPQIK